MAISVNPATNVIFVPKDDLTFESGTLYSLDVDDFRKWLKAWEDDQDGGITHLKTHNHNTEVVLSGITYSRTVEVLSPYTVEFEDGQYTISCSGANHNLGDVKVLNQVSLIINNSAGLIVKSIGSGLSAGEATQLDELHKIQGLASGSPMTVTPTSRAAGAISQTISGDGETTSTVTRD